MTRETTHKVAAQFRLVYAPRDQFHGFEFAPQIQLEILEEDVSVYTYHLDYIPQGGWTFEYIYRIVYALFSDFFRYSTANRDESRRMNLWYLLDDFIRDQRSVRNPQRDES